MENVTAYNTASFFEKYREKFFNLNHFEKVLLFAIILIVLVSPIVLTTILKQSIAANNHGQITYSTKDQLVAGLHPLSANEFAIVEQHNGEPTGKTHTVRLKLGNGNTFSEKIDQNTTLQIIRGSNKATNYVDINNPDVALYTTAQATGKTTEYKKSKKLCGNSGKSHVRCHASVITNDAGIPLVGSNPLLGAYTPSILHSAYNLPCTPGGVVSANCATPPAFGEQTIGIVDAYDDPTVEQDLATFSTQYNLPQCTKANGCLTVVSQTGGSTLPQSDPNWALEISLDVQTAHALCQTCQILLVEAKSSAVSDLAQAENEAAALGANEISNSYGSSEWTGETSYDSSYNHPGVAITAAAGDNGYGTAYPATSSTVIGVGGTTLSLKSDNSYNHETIWAGSGSGCSMYENANPWQTSVANWTQTACNTKKAVADVAADADPASGVSVYDSTAYAGQIGWYQVGGTSLSSPIVAATIALDGGAHASTNAEQLPYTSFTSTNSHDITSGSNGTCGTIMCQGAAGYDGPTGLGSPDGTTGFGNNTNPFTQSPRSWALTNDPTQQSNTLSQSFSVQATDPSITNLTVSFNLNIPGASISADKTMLNVASGATDSFTATLGLNNDQIKSGNYSGTIVYSANGVVVGTTPIIFYVKPSYTVTPAGTIDYGLDDPSQSSWTSPTQAMTITNLRTDKAQTITLSSTGYTNGITYNYPTSVAVPAGGSQTINTNFTANNSIVPNGFYTGKIIFKNQDGTATETDGTKFTKYYQLTIQDTTDSNFGIASLYLYDRINNGIHLTPNQPNSAVVYLNAPGTYDLIVDFGSALINNQYHNYVDIKEGIAVTSGTTTVSVAQSDASNAVQVVGTDPFGNTASSLSMRYESIYYAPNPSLGFIYVENMSPDGSTNYYSNFSSNYAVAASLSPQLYDKAINYFYNAGFTGGLNGNKTITNQASDFKRVDLPISIDKQTGSIVSAISLCHANFCDAEESPKDTLPLPAWQTIYSLLPSSNFWFDQEIAEPNITDQSPSFTVDTQAQRWNNGNALQDATFYPPAQNNIQYDGLGPTFWSAKFQNTNQTISLYPFDAWVVALMRQDYSTKNYAAIPYTLSLGGTQVVKSQLPAYNLTGSQFLNADGSIISTSTTSAGSYTFNASYPYKNQGIKVTGEVQASFNTSLADPNPPAITQLYYYANGNRSEVYDPAYSGSVAVGVDPVGGSISNVTLSYSTDGGKNFLPLSTTNDANLYTATIPSGLTPANNVLTLQLIATDDSNNSLTYTFQVPVGNAPVWNIPAITPTPTPTLKPTPTPKPTATPKPTPTPKPDTTKPKVSITSPDNKSTVTAGSLVTVTVNATDNVGVTEVVINGATPCTATQTENPYSCQFQMPTQTNTKYTFQALAYDAAGNVDQSAVVSVTTK